jgi:type 1 fimbria pilin
VGVALYNSKFQRISIINPVYNSIANNGVTITNGNATLQYYAAYGLGQGGAAQPGTVLATVTYQLVYQ